MVSREWSRIYGFLLGTQGTSCFKPRGSPGSSPLRSNGSHDDQVGEAGPVEHSSAEAKSLKTRGQGTVRLPPQWATTEAARRKGQRPNKGLLSQQSMKKTQSFRQLWLEAQWGKRPKKKDAYSMLQSLSCRRGWCRGWWSRWWVRTSIANHRSMRQRHGIWGLRPENEG